MQILLVGCTTKWADRLIALIMTAICKIRGQCQLAVAIYCVNFVLENV